jgi:hypothetical protein
MPVTDNALKQRAAQKLATDWKPVHESAANGYPPNEGDGFQPLQRSFSARWRGTPERRAAKTQGRARGCRAIWPRLFQVWINEDAPPALGDDGWDACMKQVDDADVVLVLYNGNAGWTGSSSGVGICHGELKRALDTALAKVRLIQLGSEDDVKAPKGAANERFRKFVQTLNLFRGAATTVDGLVDAVKQTVLHAFADLVGFGGREARKGRFYNRRCLGMEQA